MEVREETRRLISVSWTEQELDRFLLAFDKLIDCSEMCNMDKELRDIIYDAYNDLSEGLGEEFVEKADPKPQPVYKPLPTTCGCGDVARYRNGCCGESGCINVPA